MSGRFFCTLSFQRPHAPIAPAAEHFDMYDPDEMVLPNSAVIILSVALPASPSLCKRVCRWVWVSSADPNPDRLKRCLASYYALITAIDSEIGRVLDYLDEVGELENTVVLYCADHGILRVITGCFTRILGFTIQFTAFLLYCVIRVVHQARGVMRLSNRSIGIPHCVVSAIFPFPMGAMGAI